MPFLPDDTHDTTPVTELRLATLPRLENGEADVFNPIWIDYLIGLLTHLTNIPDINAEIVTVLLQVRFIYVRATPTGFDIMRNGLLNFRLPAPNT
jgi:hypothetical protein